MNDVTVLALAGGAGSRFWPLSRDKILFPFCGRPLWEYSIRRILPKEAARLVVVTNKENNDSLQSMNVSIPVVTVIQDSPRGMADAVLTAKPFIQTQKLLILIADDLFDSSLPQQIIDYANKTGVFGVLPGWKVFQYFPGGYLELDREKIIGIKEKPDPNNVPSSYVNISGHYIANSSLLFSAIERSNEDLDIRYEAALTVLMREHEFRMVPYEGTFSSLKYPWHVLDTMDALLKEIKPYQGKHCDIRQHVVIEGLVYIGNNVKIFENTKIVGPAFIGDNTIIGNNNVIRHSMIGQNCVTGFNTDITRSYIGNSCWFHSNYIGDSVLEENVSMGSGSVLANLRLDEGEIFSWVKGKRINTRKRKLGAIIGSDVRIGVNTSIMPGVKIGHGSFVGAGITVFDDVPNTSFVWKKDELQIETNTKHITTDREAFKKQL
ncbi:MAG: sugar phosphate nucleotidyltransferase [Patescibacteria group bacterium]|nr:sugar phosphate nucleotidyltransferase [Patescibacteria group bacterium]